MPLLAIFKTHFFGSVLCLLLMWSIVSTFIKETFFNWVSWFPAYSAIFSIRVISFLLFFLFVSFFFRLIYFLLGLPLLILSWHSTISCPFSLQNSQNFIVVNSVGKSDVSWCMKLAVPKVASEYDFAATAFDSYANPPCNWTYLAMSSLWVPASSKCILLHRLLL